MGKSPGERRIGLIGPISPIRLSPKDDFHLEPEPGADQYGAPSARDEVPSAQPVEVILVGQVVEIEPQVEAPRHGERGHRVEQPVSLHLPGIDVVAEAASDKSGAAATRNPT